MEILSNINWEPGIGDPTPVGWLTVFVYVIVAIMCGGQALRVGRSDIPHRRRQLLFWWLTAALLLFLAVNKQLDLQTLLTQIGREVSKTQGWYSDRRGVQTGFIATIAIIGSVAAVTFAIVLRHTLRRYWLTLVGLGALLVFVVVRAVSFHYIDLLLKAEFAGLRLNWIMELGSLGLIWLSIWLNRDWPPLGGDGRTADPGKGNERSALRLAGIAVAALVVVGAGLQILSAVWPGLTADAGIVVEPYQHAESEIVDVATGSPQPFEATFDGAPDQPTAWEPEGWEVSVHTRDWQSWDSLEPMDAAFGPDCAAPPATHRNESFEGAVFQCQDRLITAINGTDFAAAYVTPAQLVDFSDGPATVRVDISTTRLSERDWIEIWVSPYTDHLQLPALDWVADLHGEPRNGVRVRLNMNGDNQFVVERVDEFSVSRIPGRGQNFSEIIGDDSVEMMTLELQIAADYVRFGLPDYDTWWVDQELGQLLGWTQGVVQFGHHSFQPLKGCSNASCAPNSWQWDNLEIDSAVPFTIVSADQRYINRGTGDSVNFAQPAPESAYLRFMAYGEEVQVSYDGGVSWQDAIQQSVGRERPAAFHPYWTPIPAGQEIVHMRAKDNGGRDWQIRDVSVWSLATP